MHTQTGRCNSASHTPSLIPTCILPHPWTPNVTYATLQKSKPWTATPPSLTMRLISQVILCAIPYTSVYTYRLSCVCIRAKGWNRNREHRRHLPITSRNFSMLKVGGCKVMQIRLSPSKTWKCRPWLIVWLTCSDLFVLSTNIIEKARLSSLLWDYVETSYVGRSRTLIVCSHAAMFQAWQADVLIRCTTR